MPASFPIPRPPSLVQTLLAAACIMAAAAPAMLPDALMALASGLVAWRAASLADPTASPRRPRHLPVAANDNRPHRYGFSPPSPLAAAVARHYAAHA